MALKKKSSAHLSKNNREHQRTESRDSEGLIKQLQSDDIQQRRWAARDLTDYPGIENTLLEAIKTETEHVVRESIFASLQQIGGESVVSGLIDILRSEDAELRNAAIEVLQTMPKGVALHIVELLNDRDSDVRIFAIDILQVLAHPQTPEWLLSVLKDETHINVIATAVDRLAEVGTIDMIKDLEAIKQRFPDEAYLAFAVDTAIRRIKGV